MKRSLLGLTPTQLKSYFAELDLVNLDAKRVFPWIHVKSARSFDDMTDVPLTVRRILAENCSIDRPKCLILQNSSDGTQKALLEMPDDGSRIETVFIPDETRNTVCISSQVGCPMGCKFCHTGTQSFTRNLTSSEIMSQIFFWKDAVASRDLMKTQNDGVQSPRRISNLVFMGMGEPLLNYANLADALNLLLNEKAHNFSRRKITVSTCGVIDGSMDHIAQFGVKLAISLHGATDQKRSAIMPINEVYGLNAVIGAAKRYLELSNGEYITFEYLLLSGVNDDPGEARQLAKILHGIRCRVNLIIFNSWPGCNFEAASRPKIDDFCKILTSKGIMVTVRKSRGEDIHAACGQLKI
jgi:23S rRNA (adenine2503-C2)-methyltransferase